MKRPFKLICWAIQPYENLFGLHPYLKKSAFVRCSLIRHWILRHKADRLRCKHNKKLYSLILRGA